MISLSLRWNHIVGTTSGSGQPITAKTKPWIFMSALSNQSTCWRKRNSGHTFIVYEEVISEVLWSRYEFNFHSVPHGHVNVCLSRLPSTHLNDLVRVMLRDDRILISAVLLLGAAKGPGLVNFKVSCTEVVQGEIDALSRLGLNEPWSGRGSTPRFQSGYACNETRWRCCLYVHPFATFACLHRKNCQVDETRCD